MNNCIVYKQIKTYQNTKCSGIDESCNGCKFYEPAIDYKVLEAEKAMKQADALVLLKKFYDLSLLKRYTEFCIKPTDFQIDGVITPEFENSQKLRYATEIAILAVEKQIPKKPSEIDRDCNYFVCPSCGESIYASDQLETHKFCLECGQAIDWSVEK